MSNWTAEELEALGKKLDALSLTAREREILDHIIDAASGGQPGGFGDALSDAELAGISGGTGGGTSYSMRLAGISSATPWGPGTINAPAGQWADNRWSNSAVVKL